MEVGAREEGCVVVVSIYRSGASMLNFNGDFWSTLKRCGSCSLSLVTVVALVRPATF